MFHVLFCMTTSIPNCLIKNVFLFLNSKDLTGQVTCERTLNTYHVPLTMSLGMHFASGTRKSHSNEKSQRNLPVKNHAKSSAKNPPNPFQWSKASSPNNHTSNASSYNWDLKVFGIYYRNIFHQQSIFLIFPLPASCVTPMCSKLTASTTWLIHYPCFYRLTSSAICLSWTVPRRTLATKSLFMSGTT